MMTEEKIDLCKVCTNRSFSRKSGLVCGLTGEKPAFDQSCDSYVEDSDELERINKKEDEDVEDPIFPDSINDGPEKLKFANWFHVIGCLSLLNIVLNLIDIEFIFSLGTTQIAMQLMIEDVIGPVLGVFTMLALPGLLIWTGYLAKKGDRLAYLVGTLLFLFDTGLVVWFWSVLDYMPELIVNVLVHAILSVMFIGALLGMSFNKNAEKKQMTPSRIAYVVSSVIVLLINVPLFLNDSGIVATSDNKLESMIELSRKSLPQAMEDGRVMTDIYIEGNTIVSKFQEDFSEVEITDELSNLSSIYQKETTMHGFCTSGEDIMLDMILETGHYNIRLDTYDYDGNYVLSTTLSYDDIQGSYGAVTYTTSEESWTELIDAYNRWVPSVLDENTKMSVGLSEDGNAVEYNVQLVGISAYELSAIGYSDCREYAKFFEGDFLSDIAQLNKKEVVFNFTSAASSTWHKRIEL